MPFGGIKMAEEAASLYGYTPNPEFIVASAARLCYANTVNIEIVL